jgi:hypothetical protein
MYQPTTGLSKGCHHNDQERPTKTLESGLDSFGDLRKNVALDQLLPQN